MLPPLWVELALGVLPLFEPSELSGRLDPEFGGQSIALVPLCTAVPDLFCASVLELEPVVALPDFSAADGGQSRSERIPPLVALLPVPL